MRRWLMLIPLAVFLGMAWFLYRGLYLDPTELPSAMIDKPFPAFSLPSVDGGSTLTEADLKGKPALVNVWATWCISCRVEHPVLTKFAESKRLRVIGYNWKDEPADALRWLEQFGNPFWLVLADVEGRSAIDWGIYGAPETFLVDRHGMIQWKHVGPLTDAIIANELLPALQAIEGSR